MRDIEKKQLDLESRGKQIEMKLRRLSASIGDGQYSSVLLLFNWIHLKKSNYISMYIARIHFYDKKNLRRIFHSIIHISRSRRHKRRRFGRRKNRHSWNREDDGGKLWPWRRSDDGTIQVGSWKECSVQTSSWTYVHVSIIIIINLHIIASDASPFANHELCELILDATAPRHLFNYNNKY